MRSEKSRIFSQDTSNLNYYTLETTFRQHQREKLVDRENAPNRVILYATTKSGQNVRIDLGSDSVQDDIRVIDNSAEINGALSSRIPFSDLESKLSPNQSMIVHIQTRDNLTIESLEEMYLSYIEKNETPLIPKIYLRAIEL